MMDLPPVVYVTLAALALVVAGVLVWRRRRGGRSASAPDPLLPQALEHAPGGITVTGTDRRFREANPAFCRMLGYTPEELRHLSFLDLTHPDDRPATMEVGSRLASGETGVCTLEKRYVRKDGGVVPTLTSVALVRDPTGRPRCYVSHVTDLTEYALAQATRADLERRRLESLKFESLGRLAGGVSHDFNNLLTAILGNASLGRLMVDADSRAALHLQRIEQASQSAAALCQQLLTFAGSGQRDVVAVDFNAHVREAADFARPSVGAEVELELALADSLPRGAADPAQVRQIVQNLILNAAQALGPTPGKIRLTTSAQRVDAEWLARASIGRDTLPGERVCLVVSDTGPGIPPDTLSRIFDPFFTTRPGHRGLGLAAVLGIVRGHQGSLRVESEPGRGTTFTVAFPVASATHAIDPADVDAGLPWTALGTALVVDDEADVRAVAAQMLRHFGLAVIEVDSGAAAVAELRRDPSINFVLLDAVMPEMDGAGTLVALRALRPDLAVVVFSGQGTPEVRARFADLQIDGFLRKPFTPAALRAAVRAALEK